MQFNDAWTISPTVNFCKTLIGCRDD